MNTKYIFNDQADEFIKNNQTGILKAQIDIISRNDDGSISFGISSRNYFYSPKRVTVKLDSKEEFLPFNDEIDHPIKKRQITRLYITNKINIPFEKTTLDYSDSNDPKVVVTLNDGNEIKLGFEEFKKWVA